LLANPFLHHRLLVLQCYKIGSRAKSACCAESEKLTEMEHRMLYTAQTLAKIIMSGSEFSFVTL